jgi:hypothetical protein
MGNHKISEHTNENIQCLMQLRTDERVDVAQLIAEDALMDKKHGVIDLHQMKCRLFAHHISITTCAIVVIQVCTSNQFIVFVPQKSFQLS